MERNMTECRHITCVLSVFLFAASSCFGDDRNIDPTKTISTTETTQQYGLEHNDPIEIDPTLSLAGLIDLTLEKFPDRLINEALKNEADALQVRGDSWLAGSTQLVLNYSSDQITNNRGYNQTTAELGIYSLGLGATLGRAKYRERSAKFRPKTIGGVKT